MSSKSKKCSIRNFRFESLAEQNFITQNLRHAKDFRFFCRYKDKETKNHVKMYISVAIFWVVVGDGRYILGSTGWW